MTTVKVVNLRDVRKPGERRIPYSTIAQMADFLNESGYILPGPKGYLSPSTIGKWMLCPHAIYLEQIERSVPRMGGLAMIFGSGQHEAIAVGLEEYRDHGTMSGNKLMAIADTYVGSELMKLIPKNAFYDVPSIVKNAQGSRAMAEEAFFQWEDMKVVGTDQALEALMCFYDASDFTKYDEPDTPSFRPLMRELNKDGMNFIDFADKVRKRYDDMERVLGTYTSEEWYKKICTPDEIELIEEDIFVVIDGIPIYFVADLVTKNAVYDHKFTSASAIPGRKHKVPFDFQLWIYELVWGRDAKFLLYAPPPKTSRGAPRDLVTVLGRRDEGQRLVEDDAFIDVVTNIAMSIENGMFEKRGMSFSGGCGGCDSYAVCTKEEGCVEKPSEKSFSSLKRKTAGFNPQEAKAKILKEIQDATGESGDDLYEE